MNKQKKEVQDWGFAICMGLIFLTFIIFAFMLKSQTGGFEPASNGGFLGGFK